MFRGKTKNTVKGTFTKARRSQMFPSFEYESKTNQIFRDRWCRLEKKRMMDERFGSF